MRVAPRVFATLVCLGLLALAFSACGGGSTTNTAASTDEASSGGPQRGPSGASGESGAQRPERSSGSRGEGRSSSHPSRQPQHFTPERHHDSGGGAKQFVSKGGDNSIQEFGSEAKGAEFEAAAATFHDFLDARAAGDWRAACSYLAKDVVQSLGQLAARSKQGPMSCPEVLASMTNPAAKKLLAEEARKADVASLRTEGERAFIIYRGLHHQVMTLSMAREHGAWKVAGLGAVPIS